MAGDREPMPGTTRRALVVDQWPLARWAVSGLLRDAGLVDSVAVASSAEGAWHLSQETTPDLVVTDCDLRAPWDGIRLGRRLKSLTHAPLVLVYTERSELSVVIECLRGAADGFVHRSVDTAALVEAVQRLIDGRHVWLTSQETPRDEENWLEADLQQDGMTVREREVLGLLLRRYSNDEIADELHLARQTVKNYVSTVLQKLEVSSRRELYGRMTAPAAGV
ncbi:response regulator transcription factor [Kitasatospora kazusensis]|uniref:Response regulator transcription factor n=1 Tax=Kitasatospora kazusensis TaxID=407974 RepID=A0ABP5M314_9ACTN